MYNRFNYALNKSWNSEFWLKWFSPGRENNLVPIWLQCSRKHKLKTLKTGNIENIISSCDALPDWLFSFDNVITIDSDHSVEMTVECSSVLELDASEHDILSCQPIFRAPVNPAVIPPGITLTVIFFSVIWSLSVKILNRLHYEAPGMKRPILHPDRHNQWSHSQWQWCCRVIASPFSRVDEVTICRTWRAVTRQRSCWLESG